MKRDRSVTSGSTIEDGGAILVSPSRVPETGSGTRDTYISTYAQLADFVPDDLATRVNPYWRFLATEGQRIKAGEKVDRMTQARELTRLAPSEADQEAIERVEDEFRVLADEMTAYL
jgi:hypothetical protein